MSRFLMVGLTLLGCCVEELAWGCPPVPSCFAAESVVTAGTVEVFAAPSVGVAVVQPVVPQTVLVAPSYAVAPSVVASAVITHPAVVSVRPIAALRGRRAPVRASSRVVLRSRVR